LFYRNYSKIVEINRSRYYNGPGRPYLATSAIKGIIVKKKKYLLGDNDEGGNAGDGVLLLEILRQHRPMLHCQPVSVTLLHTTSKQVVFIEMFWATKPQTR
jgi:hypothetical protein